MSDTPTAFSAQWGTEDPEAVMINAVRWLGVRAGHQEPPHNLTRAAQALGARIESRQVSGCHLVLDGRTPTIVVPRTSWRTWRRQRFGVAHELCHLLVWLSTPEKARQALLDPRLHDRLERLCDLGAAELLMPEHAFRRDALEEGFSEVGLERLYDRYLVSWMSLMNRLSTVLADMGVSLWRFGVRANDPPDLPRAIASWGWSPRTYVPPGISERRLSRLMITSAIYEGQSWSADVRLRFIAGEPSVAAVGAPMPTVRHDQGVLPLWDGRRIPDEDRAWAHAALIIAAGAGATETAKALAGGPRVPRAQSRQEASGWLVAKG